MGAMGAGDVKRGTKFPVGRKLPGRGVLFRPNPTPNIKLEI